MLRLIQDAAVMRKDTSGSFRMLVFDSMDFKNKQIDVYTTDPYDGKFIHPTHSYCNAVSTTVSSIYPNPQLSLGELLRASKAASTEVTSAKNQKAAYNPKLFRQTERAACNPESPLVADSETTSPEPEHVSKPESMHESLPEPKTTPRTESEPAVAPVHVAESEDLDAEDAPVHFADTEATPVHVIGAEGAPVHVTDTEGAPVSVSVTNSD